MALTDVKSEQIQSSVALAGSPTTTTQSASDNSTKIATTAYVETAVANLVASAPSALNTLDELAAALNDDASFSTTVTNSIATKLPLAGGTLTGALTINHADGLLVHDTNGTASNRLKFLYNGTSGVATLGPHSTGGNTSLVIGTSNSGTFTTALTLGANQHATFAQGATFGATTVVDVGAPSSTDQTLGSFRSQAGREIAFVWDDSQSTLGVATITSHSLVFHTGGNSSERMRIDTSGRVGIGTNSPTATYRASIKGDYSSIIGGIEFDSGGGDKFKVGHVNATSPSGEINVVGSANLVFKTANTERMRIDSSGNVNIGAKDYHSHQTTIDSLQIGYALNLYEDSYTSGTLNYAVLANNSYYSASGGNKYMRNDQASRIMQYDGNLSFQNAPAGTADNAITFTDRFFIKADGSVGIGTNNPGYKLTVIGETYSEGLYSKGSTALGENANGQTDVTTLGGYGILSGSTRYGNYGVLRFRSSGNYTSSSRGYMITNGYGANQFAILQSTSATTMPDVASAGGGASNGHPIFISNNAGHITLPKQPSAIRQVASGGLTGVNCNGQYYQIYFDTNRRDEGSMHSQISGGGSKFTAPVAGVYFFSCIMRVDAFTGNYFYLDARINGTTRSRNLTSNTGSYLSFEVVGTYYLGSGDYITFEIANSGDSSVNIDDSTHVYVHLLG